MSEVTSSRAYARLLAHLKVRDQKTYTEVGPKTFFPRDYDLFVLDDALGNLKRYNIKRVLSNLYKSGVRFVAITNYPALRVELEPIDGISRKVNLAHYGMRPLIHMTDGKDGRVLTLYRIRHGRATS